IAQRRTAPGTDLVSALLAAKENGSALSEEELIWNSVLLLIAGHETVTDLIGNGLLALLHYPNQLQTLRDDPALMPAAIEELLRSHARFQSMQRQAREDLTLGGATIRAGERVWIILGAANRDPVVFDEPDQLNVQRPHQKQIAFGLGVHFCPGAPLA